MEYLSYYFLSIPLFFGMLLLCSVRVIGRLAFHYLDHRHGDINEAELHAYVAKDAVDALDLPLFILMGYTFILTFMI